MRGRKPKPTALKILQGNPGKRALNKFEPEVPQEMPECPDWIGKRAKKYWIQYAEELNKSGLLSRVDGSAFGAFCNALGMLEAANKDIDRRGHLINDVMKGKIKNPSVGIAKDAWAAIKAFSVEFGLTPSSRSRVVVIQPKKDNPLQQFMTKV